MADMMSPQEHYDAGMTELQQSAAAAGSDPESSQASAQRAQGQFQAGLLAAVLEDQAQQREAADGPS